jgi:hypothetical protein
MANKSSNLSKFYSFLKKLWRSTLFVLGIACIAFAAYFIPGAVNQYSHANTTLLQIQILLEFLIIAIGILGGIILIK